MGKTLNRRNEVSRQNQAQDDEMHSRLEDCCNCEEDLLIISSYQIISVTKKRKKKEEQGRKEYKR